MTNDQAKKAMQDCMQIVAAFDPLSQLNSYVESLASTPPKKPKQDFVRKFDLERLPIGLAHSYPSVTNHLKTQKARGCSLIANKGRYPLICDKNKYPLIETYVIPLGGLPSAMLKELDKEGLFVRPCPTVPRHGFVESRLVKGREELKAVWKETLKEDRNGEMLVMHKLTGQRSAVVTNASVTWGPNNDGVTGGGGETVTIPFAIDNNIWRHVVRKYTTNEQYQYATGYGETCEPLHSEAKTSSGMTFDKDITECPYFEIVENHDDAVTVQMRNGPAQECVSDYVPQKTTVQELLYAKDYPDLLKWEEAIKMRKGRKGVVVRGIEGSSLASHHAVHALSAQIPFITSKREVYVGTVLPKMEAGTTKLTKHDLVNIKYGMEFYWSYELPLGSTSQQDLLRMAVASFHAMQGWDNSELLLHLRAYAVVMILRFIFAAVMGELRYFYRHGPGARITGARPYTQGECWELVQGQDRNQIYSNVLTQPFTWNLERMIPCLATARKDYWRAGWERGYGGHSWSKVAYTAGIMANSIRQFMKTPTALKWRRVVEATNIAVNTVHNNGKAVSKWVDEKGLQICAVAPQIGFMSNTAGAFLLGADIMKLRSSKPDDERDDERDNIVIGDDEGGV